MTPKEKSKAIARLRTDAAAAHLAISELFNAANQAAIEGNAERVQFVWSALHDIEAAGRKIRSWK
jgi:hypothetical protein